MKRSRIARAATPGLMALALFAGSLAHAATDAKSAQSPELQQLIASNARLAKAVADVEAKTGGHVTGAEFDDESRARGVVEFEVTQGDGSEDSVLYSMDDGNMKVLPSDAGDHESEHPDTDMDGDTAPQGDS